MALQRVESKEKKALTVELDLAMCNLIHARARATGRTQARYVADLVSGAGAAIEGIVWAGRKIVARYREEHVTIDEARAIVVELERLALELRGLIGEG